MTPWAIVPGLLVLTTVSGCGLAGLDAYGRPNPCPGPAKPVEQPAGVVSCANTPADVILTGDLAPDDPRVAARLKKAIDAIDQPVAYTDGTVTVTVFPGTSDIISRRNQ
ncbi:MAG: hypothetical protein AAGO57_00035 [Pseudomonadota bacterium]